MSFSILLVEDDAAVAKGLVYGLKDEGYLVQRTADGQSALECIEQSPPELILLDVRLPDIDGFEVCRRVRALGHTMPIIMVTARDEEVDRILGLEIGADDYVVKPFSFRELLSRIRAQLRRSAGGYAVGYGAGLEMVRIGPLVIDRRRVEVHRDGSKIELTPIEYRLLSFFADHPDMPLSREQLIEGAWGHDVFLEDERTVDVHIRHLREKIEEDPAAPELIETVRGFGYRLRTVTKSSSKRNGPFKESTYDTEQ